MRQSDYTGRSDSLLRLKELCVGMPADGEKQLEAIINERYHTSNILEIKCD